VQDRLRLAFPASIVTLPLHMAATRRFRAGESPRKNAELQSSVNNLVTARSVSPLRQHTVHFVLNIASVIMSRAQSVSIHAILIRRELTDAGGEVNTPQFLKTALRQVGKIAR